MPTICPSCLKEFIESPALSRIDNCTLICSACGVKEAIDDYVRSKQ